MPKKPAAKSTSSLPIADRAVPYKQSKEDIAREKRWRAEEDIRTMQRADEIKKDKERVKAMKDYAQELTKAAAKC